MKAQTLTAHFGRSTAIKCAEYDRRTHSLVITFTSGGVYEWCDVPEKAFHGLKRASSAGRYFHRNIRDTYLRA